MKEASAVLLDLGPLSMGEGGRLVSAVGVGLGVVVAAVGEG